jgi:hypothetical protein
MKSEVDRDAEVDRNALREILGDLETRLEAYLVEWRRRFDIHDRTEASIDRGERRQAASERENEGVGPEAR